MSSHRVLVLLPLLGVLGCAHQSAATDDAAQHGGHHHGAHHHDAHQHGEHHASATAQHRFDDAEVWARRFESPDRDGWQKPDEVLAALALAPDALVADIGAGTGYFPVRLAKAAPRGRVYGADIEPSMVAWLEARATREGLENLSAVLAAADDAKLPEPVDLILIVDTYHHIEQRPAYFERLAASLRPGGRLAIIDFRKDSPRGPPASEKLTPEAVTSELAQAGYRPAQSFDFLPDQYFLIFTR